MKALRLHYQVLKNKTNTVDQDPAQMYTLAKQITEALTNAVFFANEVYATEGATLHATQGIQQVVKARKEGKTLLVHLTQAQYLQSFHENVGDSLHSLTHYRSDPGYAAFRAGKYVERMLLAGEMLSPLTRNHKSYAFLKALADKAALVKAGADGDDPVKIEEHFKNYQTAADLEPLRVVILTFGADIPAQAGR